MIMLCRKFPDVTVKMLRADLVERPVMGSLDHRSEALDAVGVRLPADVFGDAVANRLVLVLHALVGRRIVGKDHGVRLGVFLDEILKRFGVGLGNNLDPDFARVSVLHADNGGLAYSPLSCVLSTLRCELDMLRRLSPEIGLIDLCRAVKRLIVAFLAPRFSG